MQATHTLTLRAPDDFHVHLRDGDALRTTVPHAAQQFARVLVMPNLKPPIATAQQALAYRSRILNILKNNQENSAISKHFDPIMALYLTDNTTKQIVTEAKAANIPAFKLYPAGATTNSDAGVTRIQNIYPALEAMQSAGLRLLVHGEVTDAHVDIFDREAVFIDTVLDPIRKTFPALKIVLEHITTQESVQYVQSVGNSTGFNDKIAENSTLSATITAHHLIYNRNAMFSSGLRPHFYCLPVLKREIHRKSLVSAATSGDARFFLGTDSAPHAKHLKEQDCGCAGSYTMDCAMSLYAQVFESQGALDKLESFSSLNGARFYGLKPNEHTITLAKTTWTVPESHPFAENTLKPLMAGQTLLWNIV